MYLQLEAIQTYADTLGEQTYTDKLGGLVRTHYKQLMWTCANKSRTTYAYTFDGQTESLQHACTEPFGLSVVRTALLA